MTVSLRNGRLLEEQVPDVSRDHRQAVLEVRLHLRLAVVGNDACLAAVREQPCQYDQDNMDTEFLTDPAFALAMEVVDVRM